MATPRAVSSRIGRRKRKRKRRGALLKSKGSKRIIDFARHPHFWYELGLGTRTYREVAIEREQGVWSAPFAEWLLDPLELAGRLLRDLDHLLANPQLSPWAYGGTVMLPLSPQERVFAGLLGARVAKTPRLCAHCGETLHGSGRTHRGSRDLVRERQPRNPYRYPPPLCIERSDTLNVGAFVHAGVCALVGAPAPFYQAMFNHNEERFVVAMSNPSTSKPVIGVESAIRARGADGGSLEFENTRITKSDDELVDDSPRAAQCTLRLVDAHGIETRLTLDARTFAAWTRVALGAFDRD